MKWIARYLTAAMAIAIMPCQGVENEHPNYQSVVELEGTLASVGSDTLAPMMEAWIRAFQRIYPNVQMTLDARGSATAPPALREGLARIAPMSRLMKDRELAEFEEKHGYQPIAVRVALDAVAVYVNRDNPIKGLSMEQLDSIFSRSHDCGGSSVEHWEDLGEPSMAGIPVSRFGRDSKSGTHAFFREHALCNAPFSDRITEYEHSQGVLDQVALNRGGIGYAGIGFHHPGVRALPISRHGEAFVNFASDTVIDPNDPLERYSAVVAGLYPLSRYLYLYIDKAPDQSADPVVAEFIRFVLSKEGQHIVQHEGFIPLSETIARKQRDKLEEGYAPNPWILD